MLMADTVAILLAVVGFLLSLQGLWLFCRALWPNKVIASATRCGRNPVKSLLAGIVVTLLMMLATVLAGQVPGPGQILAFGIVSLYVVFSGIGVAGLATHMGQRLSSPTDDRRPWAATVRGGVVLELAYVVPIVGWFVILPASVVMGAGAATLALLWPRTARVVTPSNVSGAAAVPPLPLQSGYAGSTYPAASGAQHPAEVLR
jgi:hypothetical protein